MIDDGNASATSVIKIGTGSLTLTGANNYSRGTTISNGTLLVNNTSGSGTGSGFVSSSGGALGGSGIISGTVTNQAGGTLAPGISVSTEGTVLTVNSNLTLLVGSTNIMQVSHNSGSILSGDQVNSSGAITFGGTLIIATNAGDATAYQIGNTVTLFHATAFNGSFASIQPVPGLGLAWSNNAASPGNFVVVSNTVVVPPAPAAGFSGTPTNIFVTQSVVFTDTSTGSFTNSAWNFGDGNVANLSGASVSNNVINIYSNAGAYTVQLIVTGAGGSSTNTKTAYIVVKPKPTIGKPVLSDGNLILSGTNGPVCQQYHILTSTNVALPLAGWTPVFTNVFAPDGSYGYTNSPLANKAAFFLLVSP